MVMMMMTIKIIGHSNTYATDTKIIAIHHSRTRKEEEKQKLIAKIFDLFFQVDFFPTFSLAFARHIFAYSSFSYAGSDYCSCSLS